jgi:hypothetical protein
LSLFFFFRTTIPPDVGAEPSNTSMLSRSAISAS